LSKETIAGDFGQNAILKFLSNSDSPRADYLARQSIQEMYFIMTFESGPSCAIDSFPCAANPAQRTHDWTLRGHDVRPPASVPMPCSPDQSPGTGDPDSSTGDLTVLTHDLISLTHDLTSLTHDLTQRTHDLTVVDDLTRRAYDLTRRACDLSQRAYDLIRRTRDSDPTYT
jgi:hypothetical protein